MLETIRSIITAVIGRTCFTEIMSWNSSSRTTAATRTCPVSPSHCVSLYKEYNLSAETTLPTDFADPPLHFT